MDYWIVRTDSIGNILWENTYGGSSTDNPHSVCNTYDHGYVMAGYSESTNGDVSGNHGSEDFWVIKVDSLGSIVWENSFGGTGDDRARSVIETLDKVIVVAGFSNSNNGDVSGNHGNYDYWIIKLDSLGNLLWQKSFGGSNEDKAYGIRETDDKGYIVARYSYSSDGNVSGNYGACDFWMLKLNSIGDLEFKINFGGTGVDKGYSITEPSMDNFVISDESNSTDGQVTGNHGNYDIWVVKITLLDNLFVLDWEKALGGSLDDDRAYYIITTNDQGYALCGTSKSSDGDLNNNYGDYDF
ncbi:MAG: hypothetical protein Kow0068_11690 [Marinilabiliales bacterium]